MRAIIIILIISLCLTVSGQHISSRDVLYTKDGEEIRGELLEIGPRQIEFKTLDGIETFNRLDVVQIEFGKTRPGDWWRTVDDIEDVLLLEAIQNATDSMLFSGESYFVLFDSWRISVKLDGTVEQDHRQITQVTSEGSKDFVSLNEIYFFPDIETAEITHARGISPTGQVLHLDDSAVERGPVNAFIPEYDRLNILKYALGEVSVGSVVDVAERVVHKTQTLDRYFFSLGFLEEAPVLYREVVLKIETGATAHSATVNWPEDWNEASIENEPGFLVYKWIVEDIPAIIPETSMPPNAVCVPHVIISAGGSWDEIASQLTQVFSEKNDNPPMSDRILEKILPGKKDPIDKAFAIYSWIIEETGYVPVPAGIYRFEPKKLSQILDMQFGNDLDRAFLFYCLAKKAGLDVRMAFASSHDDVFDYGVPSLYSVPVPIVALDIDGKRIWIDTSTDYLPLGSVNEFIIGEPALLIFNGEAEITRVPKPPLETEGEETSIECFFDTDGTIHGQLHKRYYGNLQEEIRVFEQATEDEIRSAMEEIVGRIHPSAQLDGWRLQDTENLDRIPEMFVEFSVENYAIIAGKELIAFRLPGLDYSAWGIGAQTREWPVWFDSPYRGTHRVSVRLPEDYGLYSLPKKTAVSADSVSYTANFEIEKMKLVFTDDYSRSRLSIPPEMYRFYQEYRLMQADVADIWIVLEKKQ